MSIGSRFLIVGAAVLGAVGAAAIAYGVIDFYRTPMCSERDPDPRGYVRMKQLATVSMDDLDSGRLCASMEAADANGKTQCAVEWIDRGAGIAWIEVSGTRDCHSSANNYVFAEWERAAVIVRGRAVSEPHFREAVEHPERAGAYLDAVGLMEDETRRISSFVEEHGER